MKSGLIGVAQALIARYTLSRPPVMVRPASAEVGSVFDNRFVFSAAVLLLFWDQLTPVGRSLVIAVALVVEAFATLQYRAAGRAIDIRMAAAS